jgi:hypothetical protein
VRKTVGCVKIVKFSGRDTAILFSRVSNPRVGNPAVPIRSLKISFQKNVAAL